MKSLSDYYEIIFVNDGSKDNSLELIKKLSCQDYKIKLSYSTPGTPTENPGQESFFGRLKDECQDEINEIISFRQLQKFIKSKINYYNNKRIHV